MRPLRRLRPGASGRLLFPLRRRGLPHPPDGQIPVRHICAACGGRGRSASRACTGCCASGSVTTTRPLKVRVPAGVSDGTTLRVRRKAPEKPFEAIVRLV